HGMLFDVSPSSPQNASAKPTNAVSGLCNAAFSGRNATKRIIVQSATPRVAHPLYPQALHKTSVQTAQISLQLLICIVLLELGSPMALPPCSANRRFTRCSLQLDVTTSVSPLPPVTRIAAWQLPA